MSTPTEESYHVSSKDAIAPGVTFDPSRHMAYTPPSEVITLRELLLSEANACSPVGITKPFPLFSFDGVVEMRRDIFREEVVRRHAQKIKPGVYKMRGFSRETPFVDSAWRHPDVLNACSKAAGLDLEIMFDYEIGHVNVQLEELVDKEEPHSVLPPATPPKPYGVEDLDLVKADQELVPVRNWHVDAYPWVCVCMLSDPEGMVGGETGIEKGDGSVVKMLGPSVGWAVMMQGGCINHIALKAYGSVERITMVTSFRPKDPLVKDVSTLHTVNKSSRLEQLFLGWTTYRMDVVAKRANAIGAEIAKGGFSADEIKEKMDHWVKEQIEYLSVTCREMHDAIPYGTNKAHT